MNPKQFLQVGGVILVLFAVIGFLKPDFAGSVLSFDAMENWAHFLVGITAIVLAPLAIGDIKKGATVLIGVLAIITATLGFMVRGNPSPNLYGITNLENPVENILHFAFGVWALFAAFNKKK